MLDAILSRPHACRPRFRAPAARRAATAPGVCARRMREPAHLLATALTVGASLAAGAAIMRPAMAEQQVYRVDPDHTFVTFEALHFGTSTARGRFGRVDGTVMLDPEAGAGRTHIVVETTSVDTGVPKFDEHLRSEDFLDTARFTQATFASETFTFKGERLQSVSGMLTLMGTTLPVTLNAIRFNCYRRPATNADVCGGDFETTIVRSQWGMAWGVDRGVPDSVRIVIQIEAVRI